MKKITKMPAKEKQRKDYLEWGHQTWRSNRVPDRLGFVCNCGCEWEVTEHEKYKTMELVASIGIDDVYKSLCPNCDEMSVAKYTQVINTIDLNGNWKYF